MPPSPPIQPADIRERFLAAIVGVVPADRLAELHFFPPMRQGPIETGVAVVAAIPDPERADPAHGDRHVVFSARYRWTRKGPERGKWEHEVVAEADAPLVTVEAVVRGVKERANEEMEPDRMTGDEARALLAAAEARRQQQAVA